MCIHPKGHRFQKFDEESLFCERCGERRLIAAARNPWWTTPQVYPYVPAYPWYPTTTPRWWWENPVITWSDTGSSTYQWDEAMVTNVIAGPQTATPRGVTRT